MKVIVIGGSGFLGKELVRYSKEVVPTLHTSSSHSANALHLDLRATSKFDFAKVDEGDVVFLTAAISAPDICAQEFEQAWLVNVTGTSEFISRTIERGGRVIFFASDTVYGEREDEFDEYAACNPAGEYAEMKHEVERRFVGNPLFKSIRLSYVFSFEDKFTRYLAGCVQRKEEADLFHPFYRAIVHRDDVVAGALALAARWHEIPEQFINFGGPQVLSRIEIAECLREVQFHDLRFKVTEPDADFFSNRPRAIAMKSPIFAKLLGRPQRSLCEAVRLEFTKHTNNERL